jgi:hypothetical protein
MGTTGQPPPVDESAVTPAPRPQERPTQADPALEYVMEKGEPPRNGRFWP